MTTSPYQTQRHTFPAPHSTQNFPSHWELCALKRLATFSSGAGFPVQHQGDHGDELPFFKVSDMNLAGNEEAMVRRNNSVSPAVAHALGATIFPPGTIIFPKVGGALLTNKRRVTIQNCCIDNNLMACVVRRGNPAFVRILLKSIDLGEITNPGPVPAINESQVENIRVHLPPLDEQAAIVRYLDHADELISGYISAKERLIALLEEQRQAVIHQAVTRGLDPNAPSKQSSVEWLADVPQHWQLPEIKQVSKILRGKFTHRPRNDPSLYGGIYPFIQTGDVAAANGIIRTHRQTLNQRGLAVSTMFPAGTLVMTIAANIGDVAVLNFEACFPDSIVGFVPTNKVERDFLYYLFRAMKSEFLREAPVNTQGNLNVERIGSRKIPLPSVDEQVTIVRHLAEVSAHIDASMELAHRQVSLIGEYRTRLIADVVTGQIDVRDAVVELPGQHL